MWGRCPEAGVRAVTGRPGGGAAGCALPFLRAPVSVE